MYSKDVINILELNPLKLLDINNNCICNKLVGKAEYTGNHDYGRVDLYSADSVVVNAIFTAC